MDGVFVDTEELHFKSWQWLVEYVGAKPLTLEEYAPCIGHSGWENIERLSKIKKFSGNLENLRLLRREKFEELRKTGVPTIQENIELAKKFKKIFPEIRQIIVSSASKSDIARNLSDTNLNNFFEDIISYEEAENMPRKPSPDIYLYALKRAEILADEGVAFEDTESGIMSATSAHVQAVALPNRLTIGQNFMLAKLIIKPGGKKDPSDIVNNLTK